MFKKLSSLLAVLLLCTAAFAGNSVDVKALVTAEFSLANEMVNELDDNDPDKPIFRTTVQALEQGLLSYAEHQADAEVSANNQAIHTSLSTTIPAILNTTLDPEAADAQAQAEQLSQRFEQAVEQLTAHILANTTIQATQIDSNLANVFTLRFARAYALKDGTLAPESPISLMLMMQIGPTAEEAQAASEFMQQLFQGSDEE